MTEPTTDGPEVELKVLDGREALAAVLIMPNATGDGVLIDCHANGMTKELGAYVLRHIVQQWDPQDEVAQAEERTYQHLVAALRNRERYDAWLAAGGRPEGEWTSNGAAAAYLEHVRATAQR